MGFHWIYKASSSRCHLRRFIQLTGHHWICKASPNRLRHLGRFTQWMAPPFGYIKRAQSPQSPRAAILAQVCTWPLSLTEWMPIRYSAGFPWRHTWPISAVLLTADNFIKHNPFFRFHCKFLIVRINLDWSAFIISNFHNYLTSFLIRIEFWSLSLSGRGWWF